MGTWKFSALRKFTSVPISSLISLFLVVLKTTTESKILQEYITQESHKLEIQVQPPMAVTNAVSWRTEGVLGTERMRLSC